MSREQELQAAKGVNDLPEDFDVCPTCGGSGRQQPTKLMLAAYVLVFGKQPEGSWPCSRCEGEKVVAREREFEMAEDTDFGWN